MVDGRVDGGPGWPVRPSSITSFGRLSRAEILVSAGARRWYVGAAIALIWLISIAQDAVEHSGSVPAAIGGVALVVLFGAAFLAGAPLTWSLPLRLRLLVPAGLLALSFTLFPWVHWGVVGTWTYVGVLVGMGLLPWRVTWPVIVGLAAVALVALGVTEGWSEDILWLPAIILSISAMMAAFARTTATIAQLRDTQVELELLAVERERNRVGRDLHDILGHSLTVITVKAELAGRLIDADPQRARTEIAEVEGLARGALADVRATVAGFRGVNVSTELAAARSALAAAGIAADLPSSTDVIPADRRELSGWVVREGVTNVIRHSGASTCRISFRGGEVEVADDGIGPTASAATSTGLAGLRERVESAGGRMSVGRSDLGGFSLRVVL
ncbi:histidine kinase [Cnuibacter physcomitrellae]|uniref:Histidine kinase n=1 Tax=Cnuibacter physcomitrellae TaxID=1619308 RepID=A0A1X9LY59_9MICO|nr:sensor histidine kinase [Cnuibacter physcomitrellae]ARJ06990.1 histidine kinase [Cnuibacter physcomitrellae]